MNTLTKIEKYFEGYSAAVAQSRALISVEDALKPSLRQALYANYTDKYCYPKKTMKFLKLIGSASRFYWHGDSSCYGMMIRSAKPFAMRYPLYDAQGSYGTLMDPESYAAPRYVEGRISELGSYLFDKINKDVINDWRDNYDNTEQYPGLLPSVGFWNLCNGTSGIGTGLASSVPSFNLKEMNAALIEMIKTGNCEIPLPDFATGGILLNKSAVKESLLKGTGTACKLRAKIEYDDKNRIFTVVELPYATYTNTICKELESWLEEEDCPIDSFNDLTGTHPNIKIKLKKNADASKTLELLFSKTSLQNIFGVNLTMLQDGRYPKVFTLPEAMQAHIDHERTIYSRAFEFDLKKAQDRVHILDGYILICADIEEAVRIIKGSKTKNEAAENLTKNFNLDLAQANAILKLTLSRIASLEIQKFENERNKLLEEIERIQKILNSDYLLDQEVIKGLEEVSRKFGDARRTQLLDIADEQAEKILYFTESGKAYLNPPKHETTISTIAAGMPYFCVTKGGIIYRNDEVPKRAKTVFKVSEGDKVIGVFPDEPNKFLVIVDKGGHFRCKEISSLNKIKTTLSLKNLKTVGITSQRATKTNYKNLLEQNS